MRARIVLLVVALACCPAAWSPASDPEVPRRDVLDRWMEVRQLLSRERQDWRVGKQVLQDRIALAEDELEARKAATVAMQDDLGDADTRLTALEQQHRELTSAMEDLSAEVTHFEARVRNLLARCPPPLRDRVRPLGRRLPAPHTEPETGIGERYQNVIGILNELNKFSREITETTEVRDLPDGSTAEVTVLYLGLAQAYYCNRERGLAGVGQPGEEGWVWAAENHLTDAVAEAVAVFRNEQPAVYIGLPVEVE